MSFPWRPRSVRMRLTLWYGAALTFALLAYALFVYLFLWRILSRDLDRQLAQDVEMAERMLEEKNGLLQWDEDEPTGEAGKPTIEVVAPDGRVLFRSASYRGVTESAWRIYSRTGRVEDLPPVIIRAARPTGPLYRELGFLALVLALGIPLAVALAAGGGYALARRALAPVDRMAGAARRMTADQLGERLPVENPDDELGRLAATFNGMFARLEHSFAELRRFTADASHELRTPLAVIRSVGEVGLDERRTGEQYREIIGSMLEEADRMARLVDSLLSLSRADGGQVRLRLEPTDLAALAEGVVQQLGVLAEEKGLTLRLDAAGPAPARVDPTVLRQAMVNLVDNAIKHGLAQSEVRVAVTRRDGAVELAVSDAGPGIAAEHQARIFDRFYRVDKARSRQMGGAGLGLAIARWAVEAHGGSLTLESAAGQGSTFRMILPAGRDGEAPTGRSHEKRIPPEIGE